MRQAHIQRDREIVSERDKKTDTRDKQREIQNEFFIVRIKRRYRKKSNTQTERYGEIERHTMRQIER